MCARGLGCAALLSLVAVVLQAGAPALAQTVASPFDGIWSNESLRCTPAGNWRAPGMEVRNGRFTRSSQLFGRYFTCDVAIDPDGSFDKACGNETSIAGRVVGDRMKYTLRHPMSICEVVFKRAPGAVGPALDAAALRAETVTICAQTIDNSLRHQRATLPPERRSAEQQASGQVAADSLAPNSLAPNSLVLWGIWEGEVRFHAQSRLCAGWLFGRIDEHGEPSAIYAYNGAGSAALNNTRMGALPWRGGQYRNGTLVMTGSPASYALRRRDADTLEGSYIEAGHSYPATFKRRHLSN